MPDSPDATLTESAPRFAPGRRARRTAFAFLCRALSRRIPSPLLGPGEAESIDWVSVAEQANRERVVPSLYAALRSLDWPEGIPGDFRDYLALIHGANEVQNRRILAQILDLNGILGAAGASFVLLKGANWIMEAGAGIGDRQLTDIDLVLPSRSWPSALAALDAAGFRPTAPVELYARHFHHVPLARPGDAVTVELHRHLGWQRHLLTPEEVIDAARPLPGLPGIKLMAPQDRLILGCLHGQLQNMAYGAGVFALRDLLDIRDLLEREGDALDWPAIAALAKARGIFAYLAAPLQLAGRLLGMPVLQPFANSARVRLHVGRCLAQRWLDPGQDLGRLVVKLAWVMDSRRHAYERDCERAPWAERQAAIARGRLGAVLAVLGRHKRGLATAYAEDETATEG